jgi:hypothetical protein
MHLIGFQILKKQILSFWENFGFLGKVPYTPPYLGKPAKKIHPQGPVGREKVPLSSIYLSVRA